MSKLKKILGPKFSSIEIGYNGFYLGEIETSGLVSFSEKVSTSYFDYSRYYSGSHSNDTSNQYNYDTIQGYKKGQYKSTLFNQPISYKMGIDFYDSYLTPLENRNGDLLLNYEILIRFYNKIITGLIKFCLDTNLKLTKHESYIIMLCILHNEMHNEAFIFTKLSITNIIDFDITGCDEELLENIEFIKYPEGKFIQGFIENKNSKNILSFDNENPCFEKKIKEFSVSKYPITEKMFLEFIKNDGYKNNEYWCRNSLLWRDKNNIKLPLYWKYENNQYFKILNNTKYSVETNLPITNISYFEAKAYCKWKNVRLPTESEFEYISTNMGKTLFPWGDSNKDTNINYKNYILSVENNVNIPNFNGVMGLLGNIWQWCEEPIYPYNGFQIDPIYREMSYPFFGFKKICKGGSFAVSNFLIHPRYRNAQYPDCRIQFIGFRVCKN